MRADSSRRFWGPPSAVPLLRWRGLCLRPEVLPPADVWPPDETLLRATLRAGRWEVTPNAEGKWVAAWRHQAMNFRSTRATPEEALEALLHYLSEYASPSLVLIEDLLELAVTALPPLQARQETWWPRR